VRASLLYNFYCQTSCFIRRCLRSILDIDFITIEVMKLVRTPGESVKGRPDSVGKRIRRPEWSLQKACCSACALLVEYTRLLTQFNKRSVRKRRLLFSRERIDVASQQKG
jgi:hypothetical protein